MRRHLARLGPRTLALLLLVGVAAAWGGTFVTVKSAVGREPLFSFLSWRFLLGGGLLVAVRPLSVRRLDARGWARGAFMGLLLTAGYALQTVGLRHTSAAVSGFLTGLQVVFAPLLAWLVLRQRLGKRVWAATGVATAGLGVICLHNLALGTGSSLTIASAVFFGAQLVAMGRWSSPGQFYAMCTVELLTVGFVCTLATLPGGPRLPTAPGEWSAVLITAVVATAFAFLAQSWAQSQVTSAQAAVVISLEPVFAALAGAAAGEALGWPVLGGGALLLGAMWLLVPQDDFAEVRSRRQPLQSLRVLAQGVDAVHHDGQAGRHHLGEAGEVFEGAHARTDELVLAEEQLGQAELNLAPARASTGHQAPAALERAHREWPRGGAGAVHHHVSFERRRGFPRRRGGESLSGPEVQRPLALTRVTGHGEDDGAHTDGESDSSGGHSPAGADH